MHNNQKLLERRRELRRNQTLTEKKIWFQLRGGILGVRFKRQHSIGGYIADFYCSEKRLIVELDGEIHNTKESKEYDEVRDKYFKELDYATIRFLNKEVEESMEKVLEKIKSLLV